MFGKSSLKSSAETAIVPARSTPTYIITDTPSIFSDDEMRWQAALQTLQDRMSTYKQLESNTDNPTTETAAQDVASALRDVGDSHTDPKVKKAFYHKSRLFSKGNPGQRSSVLHDVGKGIGLLLLTPFALAAVAVFSVGGMMYGLGSIFKGIGSLLTAGFLR